MFAHWHGCSCNLHGHFVLPDGRELNEVFSRKEAFEQLRLAHKQGYVHDNSLAALTCEIEHSSLPEECPEDLAEQVEKLYQQQWYAANIGRPLCFRMKPVWIDNGELAADIHIYRDRERYPRYQPEQVWIH